MNWHPTRPQWWITAFNPETVGQADVSKQVMISSVKFEDNELLYDSLKKTADPSSDMYNQDLDKFGIFDDNNKTLWLMWYGESSL